MNSIERSHCNIHALACTQQHTQRIEVPEVLYEEVVEVEERVVLARDSCQLKLEPPTVVGTTGEKVYKLIVVLNNLLL